MNEKYYVNNKRIDIKEWYIEFDRYSVREYEDEEELVTDSNGRILGVGRKCGYE